MSHFAEKGGIPVSDTMFPKREERVPYGGGKPVRGGRGDRNIKGTEKRQEKRSIRREQPEGQKKRIRKGGRRPDRRILYLFGVVALLLIVFLMVRKNGTAVFLNEEQVGVLKGRDITAEALTETLESQLESAMGSKVKINEDKRRICFAPRS